MSQTGKNIRVAYKDEGSDLNVAPGATEGRRVRINASPGLSMQRPSIQPGEIRPDGLTSMGRLGSRAVTGRYTGDASLGAWDAWIAAVMRGAWVAAVAITEADMTSITTTTNTIVAAGGDWITEGVRVGDVVRLSNHSAAANNDRNLRVTGVGGADNRTITVAETLEEDASPDSEFTLTVLRKLKNDNPKVRRTFHIEEYNEDIDASELFGGCRVHGVVIRGTPDGMATLDFQVTGLSRTVLEDAEAPYFTDPDVESNIGLVFADANIRFAGSDIVVATSFELTIQAAAATQPVIGADHSPDVFDEEIQVSGSVSVIREDLDNVGRFDAETEIELSVLLIEPEDEPRDCMHIFVPRIKIGGVDAPKGNAGAMIETLPFMGGAKENAAGYDNSMVTISTSHNPS